MKNKNCVFVVICASPNKKKNKNQPGKFARPFATRFAKRFARYKSNKLPPVVLGIQRMFRIENCGTGACWKS